MSSALTIRKAADYVVKCRGLVARLDAAPALVRMSGDVLLAREAALESLELVQELLKRLRAEVEAERQPAPGGENVSGQ